MSLLSKLLQRTVPNRTTIYLDCNNLLPKQQYVYRNGHSVETVLTKVLADLLTTMDIDELDIIALLNMSAAFDTVDHNIHLAWLQPSFGLQLLNLA